MRKFWAEFTVLLPCVLLAGCRSIGDKAMSVSIIYGITAVFSLLLLIGYCALIRKKEPWFLLLFASVLVVNIGYFVLSVSTSLEEALLANRISYLGSVLLPMTMLMIILQATHLHHPRWLSALLLVIAIPVFLIAASPGYSCMYYQEVSLATVNGVTMLEKVYGPWHHLYLVYLLLYTALTIAVVLHAIIKKKMDSVVQGVILAAAVFVNIGVWLLEQLVKIDFELLSVSYIISELFLLALYMMIQENEKQALKIAAAPAPQAAPPEKTSLDAERLQFEQKRQELTQTERRIYDLYAKGCGSKEVMETLNIKENTLKYHNKNLYGKLGVASRKELRETLRRLKLNE